MGPSGRIGYRSHRVEIEEDLTDAHPQNFDTFDDAYGPTYPSAAPLWEPEADDAIDPAYAEHLEETSLPKSLRRQRRGVCLILHICANTNIARVGLSYATVAFGSRSVSCRVPTLRKLGTCVPTCRECGGGSDPLYRCLDCDGRDLFCAACLLRSHCQNGLHRIEVWSGEGYFSTTSLRALGFSFQLGHPLGEPCHFPVRSSHSTFTVIDTNGIHEVTLNYCGCGTPAPHFVQLLRFGWFPSTVGFPRSAATLRVLRTFQILSFESKSSAFEYYQSLARLSDNTGTTAVPDRYRAFMRMVRQYRHIKMLKRAGRGHEPSGAAGTHPRECAVLCPACPQPGVNLDSNWKDAPPEKRYLYTLFLGMDANFRLKRKMVSNNATDPSLSNGWAYFVQENEFKEFLNAFGTLVIQDPSTCSNHNAVNKERGKDGLAASGVGTVDCIRHDIKCLYNIADKPYLSYINMDYLFCSSVELEEHVEVVISYDIACQWSINLWKCLETYPSWMRVNHDGATSYRFLVPKFHLPAHVQKCQTKYSFNFNPKVGRTDGEGVERGWAHINPVASSTREMGPGARRDTLDDHFSDWNWKKITKLRASFMYLAL
ncbi:hypothetical protein BJ912DRAFT_849516 [Pholiota molesta]|nr:hypothetical protein BJ912DRAFT_849516 [Pholiota molesta]